MLDVYGCDYPMHVITRPLNMGGLLAFMECVHHSLTACLHWLATTFLAVFMIHSCQSLSLSTAQEYGLFKPDEDPTKGRWLEAGRTLEYYHLKSGVRQSGGSGRGLVI